ncbi:glycosyltransferase [Phenylobacterium deserti]|uniref:Glycosyl transferase family 28 C-terminal domain-containing protein n=1 Tax=Phenylobacterium deserti TaxID=1914756 RepID=A0A328AZ86_9CAUL|nr:glycosyltransferase [Phenylobacterium deserti]RAK58138.1 hypothetical protein DJ018_09595 [Phenylobacterium deserti]
MIFVTVGVQLPFDRLIRTMDEWASTRRRRDVLAQVGASTYVPRSLETRPFLKADELETVLQDAELIVAHAGMGSIITALELCKPIFILPRRAALGEHRNDHQLATATRMAAQPNVTVADDEQSLVGMLDAFRPHQAAQGLASQASERLLTELTAFIQAPAGRGRPGARA